jgi:hypothetical protein
MSSKKVRECLLPEFFNFFNLGLFIKDKNYKGGVITKDCEEYKELHVSLRQADTGEGYYKSEFIRNFYQPLPKDYIESKKRFQSDLNQLPFRPKKLQLSNIHGYDYLIYDLCTFFPNINALSISFCKIQFEVVQYLLDNLIYLEDLEIVNSTLYMYRESSNRYSINWPLNLKRLNVERNYGYFINTNEDYIKITSGISVSFSSDFINRRVLAPHTDFSYMPKYLPKLHTLTLNLSDTISSNIAYNPEQNIAFLKLNTHVRYLRLYFWHFRPDFLEIIKCFNNLKKLKLQIDIFENIIAFKDIRTPPLSSLKYLDLRGCRDSSINAVLFEHFPNLIDFSFHPNSGNINEIHNYGSSFEKLKSLKKLKLFNSSFNLINKTFKLPKLKNLESVEFCTGGFNNLNILTTKPRSCPNLKIVKFSRYSKYTSFDEFNYSELSTEYEKKSKVLHFPYSLAFYKL